MQEEQRKHMAGKKIHEHILQTIININTNCAEEEPRKQIAMKQTYDNRFQ